MERLSKVKPGSKIMVKRIDEQEIKKYLKNLDVKEGFELSIVAKEVYHKHKGSICIRTENGEAIIPQGIADRIYLEKDKEILSLLQMEKGDKGVIKNIEGSEAEDLLNELGIKEGIEIEFLRHLQDDMLVFKVGDREIKLGEGEASKILVESEEKNIQANYVKEGTKVTITKIVGGIEYEHKLKESGLRQGAKITLLRREEHPPVPARGRYFRTKIGGKIITIGHGMAEKICIEFI